VPPPAGPHVARRGGYFINVRYVITLLMVALGCWFLYDGFIGYPAENAEMRTLDRQIAEARAVADTDRRVQLEEERREMGDIHGPTDLLVQRVLGFTLPPLAIILLVRWLRMSRGEIRLEADDTLHAPDHPPVPASAVTDVDDARWDRKGISFISYELPDGTQDVIKLDDFVYERGPVDAIHDRLVHLRDQASAV
jgi:hypothetical protein